MEAPTEKFFSFALSSPGQRKDFRDKRRSRLARKLNTTVLQLEQSWQAQKICHGSRHKGSTVFDWNLFPQQIPFVRKLSSCSLFVRGSFWFCATVYFSDSGQNTIKIWSLYVSWSYTHRRALEWIFGIFCYDFLHWYSITLRIFSYSIIPPEQQSSESIHLDWKRVLQRATHSGARPY